MHLLYARFWHKVFFDAGIVHTKEPFQRLFNQGMVTAFAYQDSTGRIVMSDEVEANGDVYTKKGTREPLTQVVTKMAKSLKNVVNPDDIIAEHGADTFRLYEMFMGPLADSKPWNTRDIPGCRRFVERVWRLFVEPEGTAPIRAQFAAGALDKPIEGDTLLLEKSLTRATKRAEDSFQALNLNTAIAGYMTFVNDATPLLAAMSRSQAERFLRLLAPFAPHLAEELWSRMGMHGLIVNARWPAHDARYLIEDEIDLPVQVNGKLRATAKAPKDAKNPELEAIARAAVTAHLAGKELVKTVVVPGRLVNFVVK